MQLYEEGEIEKILKIKETNDKMEEFFNSERKKWADEIEPLNERINYTKENAQKIVDLQASSLAFAQNVADEIALFMQKRIKEKNKLKKAVHERIMWYAIGRSPLGLDRKLGSTQMSNVIDSHVSEYERTVQLVDGHIEYLRTVQKNLTTFGYMVKNNIEFLNYLTKN